MKKIFMLIIAVSMLLASCNDDILDLKPYDKISDASIWADLKMVEVYVNESYHSISKTTWGFPGGYYTTHRGWGNYVGVYGNWTGGAIDEIFELHDKDGWCIKGDWIVRGELSPTKISPLGRWKVNYGLIRDINNYFQNLDRVEGDQGQIDMLSAQMYFLRAWNYVHLMKNYGGVPIITKVFSTSDTEFLESRSTFDECLAFVLEDLEKAIAILPEKWQGANDGRATKGAAMALKADILLFAASPLVNPSNDRNKWEAASKAAKDIIDMPQYSLYSPDMEGDFSKRYERIFLDEGNPEVILANYYNSTSLAWNKTNFENTQNRDFAPNSYGGWGMGTPTQNIVDAFEMADGSEFDWSNPEHATAPYENRDPRFHATIFYDGRMHRGETVDTYEGGKDNPIGAVVEPTNATLTGYFLRKFVDPDHPTTKWESDCMAIFYRLGEVYLNYAEAQNELGNDGEALQYLNMIRERSGMPAVTGSGDDLRQKIRHERRIELVFEGHRYYDVRRWKTLDEAMGNAMGITIVKAEDGSKTYSLKTVQERIYTEKVYWQPVPLSEIEKNPNLTQNPGY